MQLECKVGIAMVFTVDVNSTLQHYLCVHVMCCMQLLVGTCSFACEVDYLSKK